MKKAAIIIGIFILVPLVMQSQTSFWKVESTKIVMDTSIWLEAILDEFAPVDYIAYTADKNIIRYYDAYDRSMEPNIMDLNKGPEGFRGSYEARIVGGKLKILLQLGVENIAFIICTPAGKDENGFLEEVRKTKEHVFSEKKKAIQEHPPVIVPEIQPEKKQKICFDNLFSMDVPPGFFIAKYNNQYRMIDKSSNKILLNITMMDTNVMDLDSLAGSSLFPLYEKDNAFLLGRGAYYYNTQEREVSSYRLGKSIRLESGMYANAFSERPDEMEDLFPAFFWVRSLNPETSGISIEQYNFSDANFTGDLSVIPVNDIEITFPKTYKITNSKDSWNFIYSYPHTDSLYFANDEEGDWKYKVEDISPDRRSDFEAGTGDLYVKEDIGHEIKYNIQETVDYINNEYPFEEVLMHQENGCIVSFRSMGKDSYYLLRYYFINGFHYLYRMEYEDMDECLTEFERSRKMIGALPH